MYIWGRINEARYNRNNSWLIYSALVGTKAAGDMKSVLPLPFDGELADQEAKQELDLQEMHRAAIKEMESFDWSKIKFKGGFEKELNKN